MAEENKIYVGGLSYETTSDGLQTHFSQFGEIIDCIVMVDKLEGRSRGFGFVTFKESSSMNAALGTSNVVDGREVTCKKAVRENPAAIVQAENGSTYNTVKLFVGGLPASCDYEKFTAFFQKYGSIEDAVVMMDNNTGRHRGFGYVTFSEASAVEAALGNYSGNQIDGKWIEVKRCIPQDKMAPGGSGSSKGKGKSKAPMPMETSPAAAYGMPATACYGSYSPYGMGMAGMQAYGGYPAPAYGGYAPQAYGYGSYNPAAYSAYMAAYAQGSSRAAAAAPAGRSSPY